MPLAQTTTWANREQIYLQTALQQTVQNGRHVCHVTQVKLPRYANEGVFFGCLTRVTSPCEPTKKGWRRLLRGQPVCVDDVAFSIMTVSGETTHQFSRITRYTWKEYENGGKTGWRKTHVKNALRANFYEDHTRPLFDDVTTFIGRRNGIEESGCTFGEPMLDYLVESSVFAPYLTTPAVLPSTWADMEQLREKATQERNKWQQVKKQSLHEAEANYSDWLRDNVRDLAEEDCSANADGSFDSVFDSWR